MKKIIISIFLLIQAHCFAQQFTTSFEKTNGSRSATYFECIAFYTNLAARYNTVSIKKCDTTDAGYPLHLVLYSNDRSFEPREWKQKNKVVILINNGIHPGEPDGIDASMLFTKDAATGKLKMSNNIVLAIVPVYNIGGALNRNSFSRVNQNGPESYGFRGNAQNLDLNRDFMKADSKDTRAFIKMFQWLSPDIFIDNHVSDGADYQHSITLLTTQYNKLGGPTGQFMHSTFEPALYKSMQEKSWPMCPYVSFESNNPAAGWPAFYDPPRYSSGYASLFQTMAFVTETHMLKPYPQRVKCTYAFMLSVAEQASVFASGIKEARKQSIAETMQQQSFPVSWAVDSKRYDTINFMGYRAAVKTSVVTGMPRYYYDHEKPYTKQVKFYSTYKPTLIIQKPTAYIIPQGWHYAVDLLKLNGVQCSRIKKDTVINVHYYHVDDYKSYMQPYEKHHANYAVKVTGFNEAIQFLAGDYIIYTGQRADRYIIEALEPQAHDSYFSWNFFDAVLQQKEGYSDYRWEDAAAIYLDEHPQIKQQLLEKKKADTAFAASASAQLDFVYRQSPYYEPEHLRYPVYRLMQQ